MAPGLLPSDRGAPGRDEMVMGEPQTLELELAALPAAACRWGCCAAHCRRPPAPRHDPHRGNPARAPIRCRRSARHWGDATRFAASNGLRRGAVGVQGEGPVPAGPGQGGGGEASRAPPPPPPPPPPTPPPRTPLRPANTCRRSCRWCNCLDGRWAAFTWRATAVRSPSRAPAHSPPMAATRPLRRRRVAADSPVGAFDECVALAGLAWNWPTSCAWAARVYVNDRFARRDSWACVPWW